ncbi:hypothetical protein Sgly_3095 [Syntrophobotulus glycolicus DSM 8271]|uniref:Uncharacterized protein n=1 Tax=Syntrophobotulus glycolicus (strain DSM 8271 / FlGlyR) TaxID=645991 RepID=F0T0Z2_SYNGF|nr:hypothetical protein [Syntrophobotulus glycolicus]ADY57363.1 hypothetical protein Sgly_3095 [Syntrophobotulus glycolicus DSM 8271]
MEILLQLLPYLKEFVGIVFIVILFIAYTAITGKKQAVQIILSLMLRVEKEAETLALQNGGEKFSFVVEKGYSLLPASVRIFISCRMFEIIAESLYREAKKYLYDIGSDRTTNIQ